MLRSVAVAFNAAGLPVGSFVRFSSVFPFVGDTVVGDTVVGGTVVGDTVVGDTVVGDDVVGDNVVGDNEVGGTEVEGSSVASTGDLDGFADGDLVGLFVVGASLGASVAITGESVTVMGANVAGGNVGRLVATTGAGVGMTGAGVSMTGACTGDTVGQLVGLRIGDSVHTWIGGSGGCVGLDVVIPPICFGVG